MESLWISAKLIILKNFAMCLISCERNFEIKVNKEYSLAINEDKWMTLALLCWTWTGKEESLIVIDKLAEVNVQKQKL